VPGARDVLQIPEQGAEGRFIRFSWHPTKRTVVISQWRGGVCVASTPLELASVAPLIAFFARSLHEAAETAEIHRQPSIAAMGSVREAVAAAARRLRARVTSHAPSRRLGTGGHDTAEPPMILPIDASTIAHRRGA
jgi:hypothetical protein